jgi:hypothetical protein
VNEGQFQKKSGGPQRPPEFYPFWDYVLLSQSYQLRRMSPWFACSMTAATLRQTAAAAAIEKKAIHMAPSSYRGFIEFPSGLQRTRGKAADNAVPGGMFLMELSHQSRTVSFHGR